MHAVQCSAVPVPLSAQCARALASVPVPALAQCWGPDPWTRDLLTTTTVLAAETRPTCNHVSLPTLVEIIYNGNLVCADATPIYVYMYVYMFQRFSHDDAEPFFLHWVVVWSRRPVVAWLGGDSWCGTVPSTYPDLVVIELTCVLALPSCRCFPALGDAHNDDHAIGNADGRVWSEE